MTILCLLGCNQSIKKGEIQYDLSQKTINPHGVSLIVLGTVQDAGSPHITCKKECCANLFVNSDSSRKVVSLGVIDHQNEKTYLFEATPDITMQLKLLKKETSWDSPELPNGIILTHAHIGHYTGLMYLGKEATNANKVPVFVMPKMKDFIQNNGPWSQLVSENNIEIGILTNEIEVHLTPNLKIIPFQIPHRDEYSETVGYKIIGPAKSALFIPDIDKWSVWKTSIMDVVKTVDYAFLDATFFDGKEINTRDISQIPHPFVIESMRLFENLSLTEKQKIHFIHFNHTNPLLNPESEQSKTVLEKGYKIPRQGYSIEL
ncbi:MBL fold metallo-hydrolase [Costertonia aggregata]|uniref:MBL fold metallo-hydrolase n=1 Tax=Costertonia aggregata TaxID=343403 RepID=UPI00293C12B5|nr:MBL fold metallo-hydrolase [Costertonia aggregata]